MPNFRRFSAADWMAWGLSSWPDCRASLAAVTAWVSISSAARDWAITEAYWLRRAESAESVLILPAGAGFWAPLRLLSGVLKFILLTSICIIASIAIKKPPHWFIVADLPVNFKEFCGKFGKFWQICGVLLKFLSDPAETVSFV